MACRQRRGRAAQGGQRRRCALAGAPPCAARAAVRGRRGRAWGRRWCRHSANAQRERGAPRSSAWQQRRRAGSRLGSCSRGPLAWGPAARGTPLARELRPGSGECPGQRRQRQGQQRPAQRANRPAVVRARFGRALTRRGALGGLLLLPSVCCATGLGAAPYARARALFGGHGSEEKHRAAPCPLPARAQAPLRHFACVRAQVGKGRLGSSSHLPRLLQRQQQQEQQRQWTGAARRRAALLPPRPPPLRGASHPGAIIRPCPQQRRAASNARAPTASSRRPRVSRTPTTPKGRPTRPPSTTTTPSTMATASTRPLRRWAH